MAARWWNDRSVAVVTGGNRGIGLSVCRLLAQHGLLVVLTARKPDAGLQAFDALQNEGLHNVVFHQLDVQFPESIAKFAEWLKAEYGGLDVLINNAGVVGLVRNEAVEAELNLQPHELANNRAARDKVFINDIEAGKACVEINYHGVKRTIAALLPLFRRSSAGARVINLSSNLGQLKALPDDALRRQLNNPEILTEEVLETIMRNLLGDLEKGELGDGNWPEFAPAYSMSKIAVNAYTRLLAGELKCRPEGHKIYANVVHPGWVKTEMTRYAGDLTTDESAEGIVWLALLAHDHYPSGQFFFSKQPFEF